MRTRAKLTVAAAVVGLAVSAAGGATAVTDKAQPQPPAAKSAAKASAAGPVDTSTEATYTAITPCRLVDTRKAGGMITPTGPRSFTAPGNRSLAAQGGDPAGCGIPDAAVAIQATVVAVGSAGSGFLKVYPDDAPPDASFLNFRDGEAVANGGTITIDWGFTVLTSRTTHVVVDVSGYFIKPMWARVRPDGSPVEGSRWLTGGHVQTGTYQIVFDRDVSHCAYDVTPSDSSVFAQAQPLNGQPPGVSILLEDSTGAAKDAEFYLTVTC